MNNFQTIVSPELWEAMKPTLKAGSLILTGVVQSIATPTRRLWKGLQVRHAHVLDFNVPVGMVGEPGVIASKKE